jgi:lysyl-tRNA synthetase class 2
MYQQRAAIIRKIRSFFDNRGYLELDTPLLSPDLIPESCLEVFQTERLYPFGSRNKPKPLWLIPSPEIWMKKIIAQHRVSVYQICKCFRNGESTGHLHNSEFTMLEYYTMDADYMDSLKITEDLLVFLAENSQPETASSTVINHPFFYPEFNYNNPLHITVAQAFSRWAGFDLFAAAKDKSNMYKEAQKLGLEPPPGLTIPELYDLIFIHTVEPNFKMKKPVFLLDYPAFVSCLAKHHTGEQNHTVERWELYYNGIELANCFSEETDPQQVKDFFINEETEKKHSSIVQHNVDHNYWKIFENKQGVSQQGFPKCSGVAMGVDRLIMALTGRSNIDGVLPFPLEN